MDVGREIRRIREGKGWSQTKLAAAADMGVSGISQIETGARNPSAVTLWKIAEALGVEVGDLYPKAQASLPLEDGKLADRPKVREWLREQDHMSREEFIDWAEEHESLEEIEGAIEQLWQNRDQLLESLKADDVAHALFGNPAVLREGLVGDEWHRATFKPGKLARELRGEIRHEYLRRELTLETYSRQLYAEGVASDYLDFRGRPENVHTQERRLLLEAERHRRLLLEQEYAKAAKAVAVR
jgi:transcriptional regulator with XRE-family HTH domain